jgi:hypothetical protein
MENVATPSAPCWVCEAPERRVWTPRADVPAFETVAERTWTVLGRCANCGRFWVRGSYEPFEAFVYWVLWPLAPDDFSRIAGLADELVIGAWITAEIMEQAASLPHPDQAAISWHHERSYGRDPAHEHDPLPKPEIDWVAAALRRGDERVMRVVEGIVEAARRRGATVRPLREKP